MKKNDRIKSKAGAFLAIIAVFTALMIAGCSGSPDDRTDWSGSGTLDSGKTLEFTGYMAVSAAPSLRSPSRSIDFSTGAYKIMVVNFENESNEVGTAFFRNGFEFYGTIPLRDDTKVAVLAVRDVKNQRTVYRKVLGKVPFRSEITGRSISLKGVVIDESTTAGFFLLQELKIIMPVASICFADLDLTSGNRTDFDKKLDAVIPSALISPMAQACALSAAVVAAPGVSKTFLNKFLLNNAGDILNGFVNTLKSTELSVRYAFESRPGLSTKLVFPFKASALTLDVNSTAAGVNAIVARIRAERINHAPTLGNVRVSGGFSEGLSLSYVYSDVEGDADRSTVRWFKNGLEQSGLTGKTVAASLLTRGDIWFARVTASDSGLVGSTYDSPAFRINSLPSVSSVLLIGNRTAGLTLSYSFSDPDGNPDVSTIDWYRNGTRLIGLSGKTVSASALSDAEAWQARVNANDGVEPGGTYLSNVITIGAVNNPPFISNIRISGNSSAGLMVSYDYTDPEGDSDHSAISWKKGGVTVPGLNSSFVPASFVGQAEIWRAVIAASDGKIAGATYESPDFKVNTKPAVSNIVVSGGASAGLTLAYNFIDPDADADMSSFKWLKNGVVQTDLTSKTVPPGRAGAGEVWNAVIFSFDGKEPGPNYQSSDFNVK